ncbi:trans-sulfuration enzyme family protein [Dyadobacter sandarakinus]|uniref:PLP-dependent transferase n=1 Tax=Dyadobacter sandarakinus TaxID=2747268 RepID=A0ABX7ICL2_9BACT|nr:PLP-dependent aspartate aminotransferase family protein [Dyadobacter sandarakinus]QRR02661.1 PLP-dependent transferase [Dyadobacter sandarakinus]
MKFGTKAIHAGVQPDPATSAIMTPIYQTSTYALESPGKHKGYTYSRSHNPTRTALQEALASLENGTAGICFASGQAATDAVLKMYRPGDEIIVSSDLYGGTYRIMKKLYEPAGLIFRFADLSEPRILHELITEKTKLVWIETPTNPLLKITDIGQITTICKSKGVQVAVDNTFASPYLQNPLDLGADIVMHSVTKYLGGHSDVIMGALIVRDEGLSETLSFIQNTAGAVPGPQDCFLVLRGLKTLHLRMQRHCENAAVVAQWLTENPKVGAVYYPGLAAHPQHELARKQMRGFGGMLSFELKGDVYDDAVRVFERFKLFALAESLGGVESLCAHPATMSHASFPPEERLKMGVKDTLIRLSVGVEDIDDIITDLAQAIG